MVTADRVARRREPDTQRPSLPWSAVPGPIRQGMLAAWVPGVDRKRLVATHIDPKTLACSNLDRTSHASDPLRGPSPRRLHRLNSVSAFAWTAGQDIACTNSIGPRQESFCLRSSLTSRDGLVSDNVWFIPHPSSPYASVARRASHILCERGLKGGAHVQPFATSPEPTRSKPDSFDCKPASQYRRVIGRAISPSHLRISCLRGAPNLIGCGVQETQVRRTNNGSANISGACVVSGNPRQRE